MTQNYSEMLVNGLPSKDDIDIQDIPLIINMVDTSYPLAFIDYETDEAMGINYTVEDGTERFVVINKKYIIDIGIMYEQDIDIVVEEEQEDGDVMYQ